MLTIGEFSRLTQIPAKTLRYYDEIGLFQPVKVDPFTSYRYYSMTQLPRLYRILALKALGLSLEQIDHMLNGELSTEQLRGMLELKQAELRQHLAREQQRLNFVENKLKQLEKDGLMSDYAVVIKEVEPVKVAMLRSTSPDMQVLGKVLGGMYDTLIAYLHANKVKNTSDCISVYFDEVFTGKDIQIGAALPIAIDLPAHEHISQEHLPAQTMASVIHKGSFDKLSNAYEAILAWIEQNDYTIVGANREVTLAYDPTGEPSEYITEVQFPIQKR